MKRVNRDVSNEQLCLALPTWSTRLILSSSEDIYVLNDSRRENHRTLERELVFILHRNWPSSFGPEFLWETSRVRLIKLATDLIGKQIGEQHAAECETV